jgi:hypothetical protein
MIRSLQHVSGLRATATGEEPPIALTAAPDELLRAGRAGRLIVRGQEWGRAPSARVPVRAMLEPRWNDRDGQACIIDGHRDGRFWAELWVRADECQGLWPPPASMAGASLRPSVEDKKATARVSKAAMDAWYATYVARCVAKGLAPNVLEDEAAARKQFGDRYDRDRLRDARRRLAPSPWSSRQKGRGKRQIP